MCGLEVPFVIFEYIKILLCVCVVKYIYIYIYSEIFDLCNVVQIMFVILALG